MIDKPNQRESDTFAPWSRDSMRMATAIQTTARMLLDHRERATETESRIRHAARVRGHDIDTRADYASGSAAAYSIACSILAGAMRTANVEELTGEWQRDRGMQRPELPGELLDGDHFAGRET